MVAAHGRTHTFGPRQSFGYWNPAHRGNVLVTDLNDPSRLLTYRVGASGWEVRREQPLGSTISYFSPEGRRLVYTPYRGGHVRPGLIRIEDRRTGATQTFPAPGLGPMGWSPDDRVVAFTESGGDVVLWTPGSDPLPIAERSELTDLLPSVRNVGFDGPPIWSRDGSMFALRAYWRRGEGSAIVVGTLGGIDRIIRVGRGYASIPTWSPTRDEIAFVVSGDGRRAYRRARLVVYDVTRGQRTVLAAPVSDPWWVSWSPRGNWLLIDHWTQLRSWLFVSRATGRQVRYPNLGGFPRWCCPSSPSIGVLVPVS